MKIRSMFYLALAIFLSGVLLVQTTNAVPKKGTLRVSGDNTWTAFIDGKEVAQSGELASTDRQRVYIEERLCTDRCLRSRCGAWCCR